VVSREVARDRDWEGGRLGRAAALAESNLAVFCAWPRRYQDPEGRSDFASPPSPGLHSTV
jgi:hypothetical protein